MQITYINLGSIIQLKGCSMGSEIPMENFFRKPAKFLVRISPCGDYLAWLEPWQSRLNVHVKKLDSGIVTRVTSSTERDVSSYIWADKMRIVFMMDKGGAENLRLYGVNIDGSNTIDYTPYESVKCAILTNLPDDNKHILFQMNYRDKKVFDVYKLNIETGKKEMISKNPGNVTEWFADFNGKVRLAKTADGLNSALIYRVNEKAEWLQIASYDFRQHAKPIVFSADNSFVYVSSNVNRDKVAIFEYDLTTGKEGKVIFQHPEVDVWNLLYSVKRRKITGVSYEVEKREFYYFDEFSKKIQKFLNKLLPDYHNSITSFDHEETKCIVHSGGDRTFGSFYLLDLENWKLEKLFDLSPWLSENEMAVMKPIKYKARDGKTIHGYLTLPKGVNPKNLPLIVNPHGGPWARDSLGFRQPVQFLANRGFAVLKMNFRGSTGYGRKFLESGYGQWGLVMQDDITDGVNWVIDSGIADPKRNAIYGVSYGGYAALMGIVKTPDLYSAAVDYVGVSNLFTILENMPPYLELKRKMMYKKIGHPVTDKERLKKTSPALNADKIKTPLFIAQGANDPRVNKSESDQMVSALRNRGVFVEYMVKENEGHGFRNEENIFDFFRAMERFLKKHIKRV